MSEIAGSTRVSDHDEGGVSSVEESSDSGELVSVSDLRPAAIVATAFSVVATFLVIIRSNNYIELADQSLYLLMIDDPEAAIRSASGFHVLIAPLFSLVGESVVGLRIARAILDIGVDIALGVSLLRYLRSRGNSEVFDKPAAGLAVVSTITLGGFAAWIFAVNGFGYDQLGAIVFTALLAVVLWLIGGRGSASTEAMLAASAGAIFSLALIVRWTAALAALGFLIWLLTEHFGFKRTRSLLGAWFVGAVAALAIVHVAVIDVDVLARGIRDGTVDIKRDSHSFGVLINQYVVWLWRGVLASVGLILASAFTVLVIKQRHRMRGAVSVALVGSGLVMIGLSVVLQMSQSVSANVVGTFFALTCSALIVARARTNWKVFGVNRLPSGLALPVTLTVLPVFLAAGSLLPIFLTSLPLATFWVSGLWVLLPSMQPGKLRTAGIAVGAVLLSSMPWLLWQSLEAPQRTQFAEEPVRVETGRFEGLLVDETTQQLLHDLEDLRLQLDPNPTVLSFWVRPVVPFALEGTGLGFPWYSIVNAPNAAAETISGACLNDGDTPTGDVVFVTEESNPAEFGPIRGALRDCGIDFPVGFELVTTMVAPSESGNVELSVYLREGNS